MDDAWINAWAIGRLALFILIGLAVYLLAQAWNRR